MKIMFYTNNHLGDVVIMTAVIANLKSCYPEIEFGVDAAPHYMEVFDGNPNISRFKKEEADHYIECVYAPFSQRTANGGSCMPVSVKCGFTVQMKCRSTFCSTGRNLPP